MQSSACLGHIRQPANILRTLYYLFYRRSRFSISHECFFRLLVSWLRFYSTLFSGQAIAFALQIREYCLILFCLTWNIFFFLKLIQFKNRSPNGASFRFLYSRSYRNGDTGALCQPLEYFLFWSTNGVGHLGSETSCATCFGCSHEPGNCRFGVFSLVVK